MILQERIYPMEIGERFIVTFSGQDSKICLLTTPKLLPNLITKAAIRLAFHYPAFKRDFNKSVKRKDPYATMNVIPMKDIYFVSFLINDKGEAISGFYRNFETIPSDPDSLLGVKMNGYVERISINKNKEDNE